MKHLCFWNCHVNAGIIFSPHGRRLHAWGSRMQLSSGGDFIEILILKPHECAYLIETGVCDVVIGVNKLYSSKTGDEDTTELSIQLQRINDLRDCMQRGDENVQLFHSLDTNVMYFVPKSKLLASAILKIANSKPDKQLLKNNLHADDTGLKAIVPTYIDYLAFAALRRIGVIPIFAGICKLF